MRLWSKAASSAARSNFALTFPFSPHWFQIGPHRLHYVDEGRGEAVVCLHGNPTWSFYYRNVIAALRGEYRVIAPDHIGCGLSDKPDDEYYEYTLARRVEDFEGLLDHLGLGDNLTLVLHDWGGMIGMAAAVRRPERIRRLVILNTAAFRLPPERPLPLRLRVLRDGGPLAEVLVRGLNLFAWPATFMAVRKPLPPDVRNAYLSPYDSWKNRISTLRFVQDIPLHPGDRSYDLVLDTERRLRLLRDRPMLICWGEHDFVFDRHFLAEWRRHFPAAEVHTFPDAGHYVLEDAGDRIIPLIRDFLARHPV